VSDFDFVLVTSLTATTVATFIGYIAGLVS
jgi:type III secretory pathway component EscS